MLGDDALICSQRLTEWISRAPGARGGDRAGQHRARPARPGPAAAGPRRPRPTPAVVPALPEGSPVPAEDALAFFRDDRRVPQRAARRAATTATSRTTIVAAAGVLDRARLALLERLRASAATRCSPRSPPRASRSSPTTATTPAAGSSRSAQGTEESRRRLQAALDAVWPLHDELFRTTAVEQAVAAAGRRGRPGDRRDEVDVVLEQVFSVSGVDAPDGRGAGTVGGRHRPRRPAHRGAGPAARRDAGGRPRAPGGGGDVRDRTPTRRRARRARRRGPYRPRDADADPRRPRRAARRRGRRDGTVVVDDHPDLLRLPGDGHDARRPRAPPAPTPASPTSRCEVALSPAWSSDWITSAAAARWPQHGHRPRPGRRRAHDGPVALDLMPTRRR